MPHMGMQKVSLLYLERHIRIRHVSVQEVLVDMLLTGSHVTFEMLGTLEGASAMRTLLLANCPASLGLGSKYVRHFMYSNCINRLRYARKRHRT
jgi:hypothetical protein